MSIKLVILGFFTRYRQLQFKFVGHRFIEQIIVQCPCQGTNLNEVNEHRCKLIGCTKTKLNSKICSEFAGGTNLIEVRQNVEIDCPMTSLDDKNYAIDFDIFAFQAFLGRN